MAELNLLDRSIEINEQNALDFNLNKLKLINKNHKFRLAIDNVNHLKMVFKIAKSLNKLQNIGYWYEYMNILRWLRGEMGFGNFGPYLDQISDVSELTDGVIDNFLNYLQALSDNLRNDQTYNQIEISILALDHITPTNISKAIEEKTNSFIENVSEICEESKTDLLNIIENQTDLAISNINNAQSLSDWGEAFDREVDELHFKLYGEKMNGLWGRNYNSLVQKIRVFCDDSFCNVCKKLPKNLVILAFLLLRNLFNFVRVKYSQATSIKGRRAASFFMLFALSLGMVIFPILNRFEIVNVDLLKFDSFSGWVNKIGIFLPLVAVLTISYSFNNKNYRIYSNILDQYRHRRVVGRTAQGIILNLNQSKEEDDDLRKIMISTAAVALFEHKNTGHLSKKEAESITLSNILKTMMK